MFRKKLKSLFKLNLKRKIQIEIFLWVNFFMPKIDIKMINFVKIRMYIIQRRHFIVMDKKNIGLRGSLNFEKTKLIIKIFWCSNAKFDPLRFTSTSTTKNYLLIRCVTFLKYSKKSKIDKKPKNYVFSIFL